MERSSLIGTVVLLAAIAATFILSSCEGLVPTTSNNNTTLTQSVATGGRVVYREENGGFFGILADDGRQYEPSNLDLSYHVEGLRVKFSGSRDTTVLGRHQWGNPVEIAKVESSK
jgi:hypothetical protein